MNKYSGSNFDDFLAEEGILEEVSECAQKRLLALQIEDIVNATNQSTEGLNADPVGLNHYLFDPDNPSITVELLNRLTSTMSYKSA